MDCVEIGKNYVKSLITAIVDAPDDIRVEGTIDERGILLKINVHPDDQGRVIGRGGETINAVRQLLHALGKKHSAYYSIKVLGDA